MNTNYNVLMKNLRSNNEVEKLQRIDNRITEIIPESLNSQKKLEVLEALICMFEGKSNVATSYAIIALAYTVLMGAIALLPIDEGDKIWFFLALMVATFVLVMVSVYVSKRDSKIAFVLNVLRFRYEREKNCSKEQKEDYASNGKQYIVTVKENV